MGIFVPYTPNPSSLSGGSFNPGPGTGVGGSIGGGVAIGTGTIVVGNGTPQSKLEPEQIIGFVPLTPCTPTECREYPDPCCYYTPAFGKLNQAVSSYENDITTFLLNFPLIAINPLVILTWNLQKVVNGEWTNVGVFTGNNYGKDYPIGFSKIKKYYVGYQLSWGKVLALNGPGCYRVRVEAKIPTDPRGEGIITYLIQSCLQSEPFQLWAWDCNLAHQTVKFESTIGGKIGNINNDGKFFDLCDVDWIDSIRFKGFFGYETTPEYLEVLQEYQNGTIKRVRDEAIQKFKLISGYLPKWVLDRFKTYGLMADQLRVSDYNINNSDWEIKRKIVIKDGGFEPEWRDKNWFRRGKVEMDFKEGVQSVIKSSCCETIEGGGKG